jgi:hypothetical protein
MKGLQQLTQARWVVGLGLSISLISACTSSVTQDESGVTQERQESLGGAGSSSGSCTKRDSADTTCDLKDDDCDGKIDEDCEFGPMQCPAGSKIIQGTSKDDLLVGTSGKDCILGYGGNDTISGLGGDDVLVGGPGNDTINGGSGNDTIIGGNGDDKLYGGSGSDNIDGGNGNDYADGESDNDTVHGGACHDKLNGSNYDNMFGDDGADRITNSRLPVHTDGGNGTDACEGTNCEISSTSRACYRDYDCSSGKKCIVATGICVPSSEIKTTDPTCDGLDDDCDGKVDENYVSVTTTCGAGACGGTGKTSCVHGHVVDSCMVNGMPTGGNDATCDGKDDDCDGKIDENYASTGTSCGVGACSRSGATSCVGGVVQNSCTAGTPAASDATCNGVDDNCNGSTDEGYVASATNCGVGACASTGMTSCVAGHEQNSCMAGTPAANDATCNGVDDNCNGSTDEGYVAMMTMCGVGACANTGMTSCVGGQELNSCMAGMPAGNDANCNGVDDNCNGAVDEGFVAMMTNCGAGACASTGMTSCVGGMLQDSCHAGTPGASDTTCDGVDDNCNGSIDEGYMAVNTTCGFGACLRSGMTSCVAGHEQNSCSAGAPAANDASCNSTDDDCDGSVDEDFATTVTHCGVGACERSGTNSCVNGQAHNSCMAGTPAASDTTCDGIDDNCNGSTDEGFVSTVSHCGVGSCARNGTTSCASGSLHDSCTPGNPAASDTTCDGMDDNCNGSTDEGYAPMQTNCGIGGCARTGTTSCVGGGVQNSCIAGVPAPNDASCNGVDDNCNGTTDEDFVATCSGAVATTCTGGHPVTNDCNDSNSCNGSETCTAGMCHAGTPVSTDDGDPCTTDTCDQIGGVRHTPVQTGTSCADATVCNGNEFCMPPNATTCSPLRSGAVAWWPGDGNANEVIAGLDGTLVGGLGFTNAEVGKGFNFDGMDDAVDVSAHAGALSLAGQATIEMWVLVPSDTCRTLFQLKDGTHQQLLQVGANCTSAVNGELVTWSYTNGAATTIAAFQTTSRMLLTGGVRLHHLALTFDGANTKIYIDGALKTPTAQIGNDKGIWGNFPATVATIGAQPGVDRFVGVVDEVTLYDHALSDTEIAAINAAGASGQCKPPVCMPGTNASSGTSCEDGGTCDGAGMCVAP